MIVISDANAGEIKLFRMDILDGDSYGETMVGSSVVLHTASPFKISIIEL